MRKAGLTGIVAVLAAFGLLGAAHTAAQETAPFEVVVTGPEGDALWVQSALEVRVDDLVFDYQETASPPEDAPDGLASAQAEGYRLYGPGQAHWGNAAVTLAPGGDTDQLYQWFQETARGKEVRKSISIVLLSSDMRETRRYTFHDCFPVRWKAPELNSTSDKAVGTLVVGIGRIEFTTRLNPGPVRPGSVALTVKDEDGDIGSDTYTSWSGGEPRLHVDALLRGARLRTASPGHKTVNELTLRGAMTDGRPALDHWLNSALEGRPWMRSVTVAETGRRPGRSYTYHDCFPIRYVFPRMSVTNTTGNTMEEVSVKPIRLELK